MYRLSPGMWDLSVRWFGLRYMLFLRIDLWSFELEPFTFLAKLCKFGLGIHSGNVFHQVVSSKFQHIAGCASSTSLRVTKCCYLSFKTMFISRFWERIPYPIGGESCLITPSPSFHILFSERSSDRLSTICITTSLLSVSSCSWPIGEIHTCYMYFGARLLTVLGGLVGNASSLYAGGPAYQALMWEGIASWEGQWLIQDHAGWWIIIFD